MQLDGDTLVYLTGGTGFVGSHLRCTLVDRNVPVTLLVREGSSVTPKDNEQVHYGDVTRPQTLSLDDHDVVIHLAAQTSIEAAITDARHTWNVNATGTLNVLEAAREAAVERVLYASTASIYGPPDYLPIDESHPTNPVEPYGASKLGGDGLARSYASTYDLDVVIARLFNSFGLGQPAHNVVPSIISQAVSGDAVELGNLSPARDFVYISDVVRGLMTVLTTGASATAYNIGRGDSISVREVARMVTDLVESDADIISTAERQRSESVEIPDHVADVSRLRELGWTPEYTVREGLAEMIEQVAE